MATMARLRTRIPGVRSILALLVLVDEVSADEWTVTCNTDCGGVNTCADRQLCSGDMTESSICPNAPVCPMVDDACPPVPCMWGVWNDWSNDGSSGICRRARSFTPSSCGGTPCYGTVTDTKYCEPTIHTPQNCLFSAWSEWLECDPKTLQRERSRRVVAEATYGGLACEGPLRATQPCGNRVAPLNCVVGEWMEWSGCSHRCKGGQQMQVRTIIQQASDGGELCRGENGKPLVLHKTRPCNEGISCQDGPLAQDCMLTEWSEWSLCDPDVPSKATQRYRSRSIAVPGSHGGAPCNSQMEETTACEASDILVPVDCRYSPWTAWNLCDKSCDAGQTYRSRTIEAHAQRGGRPCQSSTLETKACNEMRCVLNAEGADCVISQWSSWGLCSTTCGPGIRTRERALLAPPLDGGLGCDAVTEEVDGCFQNPPCDAVDCEWGSWSQWTDCTKSCDGGDQSRHRSIFIPPSGGGKQCAALESTSEIRSCSTQPCLGLQCEDGRWESWGQWSHCSRECGGGIRWRNRKIGMEAMKCGKPAVGAASEEAACNTWKCEVDRDCVLGEWTRWSECSASCDGQQTRSREIVTQGSGRGRWCTDDDGQAAALREIRSCNGVEDFMGLGGEECGFGFQAPEDCQLDTWSAWSECSVSCGGGQHSRLRNVLQPAKWGGKPCSTYVQEVKDCNTDACGMVLDCQWDEWGEWGACSRCDGERLRIREIRHLGNELGRPCEASSSRQMEPCNFCPEKKTYWCVWSEWQDGLCSTTCGTGGKARKWRTLRKSPVPPANLADAVGNVTGDESSCDGREAEYTACKNVPVQCDVCVPQNCVLGEWSDWEQPQTCDGLCTRERKIVGLNNDCGTGCSGSFKETKSCSISECNGAQACTFSHWSDWNGCEEGSGQQTRVREVALPTGPLGAACVGDMTQTKPCEATAEKVDCTLSEWAMWGECSQLCGGGQRYRGREVLRHAENGGASCTGTMRQTQSCGEGECGEHDVSIKEEDCVLADWSDWTGCDSNTGNMQAFRTRGVARQAYGGGLPCVGSVKESGSCPKITDRDCRLSDWSPWGGCAATCGGGQRFRTREVVQEALPGGAPCAGDVHEAESCAEIPCDTSIDCIISHWSYWSECSSKCGQGQQVRQRKILQAAQPGGAGCDGELLQVQGCQGRKTSTTCNDDVDCQWGFWSDWSSCQEAEYCGLGFRTRTRDIAVQPKGRGELCDPLPTEEVIPDTSCAKSCTIQSVCVDGQWGLWSPWSECSITCGSGGTRVRHRVEVTKASHCGKPAEGESQEYGGCDATLACESELGSQDCLFGQWSHWEDCSSACNGFQRRAREILRYSAYGGAQCTGAVAESQRCNPGPDDTLAPPDCESGVPVDCIETPFTEWSDCSATCGTGHQSRNRAVSQQPAFGGKDCENPLMEIKECAASIACVAVDRDCVYSNWKDWSSCDALTGQQKRIRHIQEAQAGFGAACEGTTIEVRGCERSCKDKTYYCNWQDWADWSSCSAPCGPKGRRTRSRSLKLTEAISSNVTASLPNLPRATSRRLSSSTKPNRMELVSAFVAGFFSLSVVAGTSMLAYHGLKRLRKRYMVGSFADMTVLHTSGDVELQ